MQRPETLTNDEIYHVYNRGVAKQTLFHDNQDYRYFFDSFIYYLDGSAENRFSLLSSEIRGSLKSTIATQPLVEILAYCLMPNHFHFVLRQLTDQGITTCLRKTQNSYTRAYNTRYRRVGPLFQGRFKTNHVESDEQLLHLSRYVHLNPVMAKLTELPEDCRWSSMNAYLHRESNRACRPAMILTMMGGNSYQDFVNDYVGFARELDLIKKLIKDDN